MRTDGNTLYYSSLPNEAPKKGKDLTTPTRKKDVLPAPSPRQTIESASSSISNAVVTSVNSARKIKDRARSYVPKKLLSVQCTPVSSRKGHMDEVTPVLYYQDEDTVTKQVGQVDTSFVDPFSFGDAESQCGKEDGGDVNSPTSIVPVRLFPEDSIDTNGTYATATDTETSNEENDLFDEVVTFDCPVFTPADFKFNEEDTSIDISEAIKSINAISIKEEAKSFRESIREIRARREAVGESLELWKDPILSWNGFTKAECFNTCEWDPKSNDAAEAESSNDS